MRVHIRLFAGLRDRAGANEVTLDLPDDAVVSDALTELRWLTGDTHVVMAVNREYATAETALAAEDELALIPPVSGGAGEALAPAPAIHVRISADPLSADAVTALVTDSRAGAVVTFLGVTRDVPALEYEAYVEMAEAKLLEIVTAAAHRNGLCSAAAEHRIGTVGLSEPSVVIAVSAPHRAEAFTGAREIIDELKAQAPIWKREEGEWIAGSNPGSTLM